MNDVLSFLVFGILALAFTALLAPMLAQHLHLATMNATTIEGHYDNMPNPFDQGGAFRCWDCFDFEAAVAHEVGHLLGLGHPDAGTQNSYHVALAEGYPFNSTNCDQPWSQVALGVPPGVVVESSGVRSSMMLEFSQHNPSVCVTADDLEGLNVLYPTCSQGISEPICNKADINVGALRLCFYILVPSLLAFFLAVVLHTFIDRYEARVKARDRSELSALQKSAEKERAEITSNERHHHHHLPHLRMGSLRNSSFMSSVKGSLGRLSSGGA